MIGTIGFLEYTQGLVEENHISRYYRKYCRENISYPYHCQIHVYSMHSQVNDLVYLPRDVLY